MEHLQACREGIGRLIRHPYSNGLTVLVLAVALMLPTSLWVLGKNMTWVKPLLARSADLSIYMKVGVTDLTAVQRSLSKSPWVKSVQVIPSDEGLAQFKQAAGMGAWLDSLDHNPLPTVITVHLNPQITPRELDPLVTTLEALPAVDSVDRDQAWLERLNELVQFAHQFTWLVWILLCAVVVLIVAHVIRITVMAHENEQAVHRILGATAAYIRRPLLYLGAVLGLFSAFLCVLLMAGLLAFFQGPVKDLVAAYGVQFTLQGLGVGGSLEFMVLGLLLGWIGAFFVTSMTCRESSNPMI